MLTPRDNYIRFLNGDPYEWAPTSGDQRRFAPAFIPDNVARGMVIQQEPFPVENYGGKDLFGVEWIFQPEANGSMEKQPLFSNLDDLYDWREKLAFPDLNNMDWEACARENADYLSTDKLLITTIYTGFFERLISLVGFEGAAIALAEFYILLGKYLKNYFNIEYVEFHDDWGTQNSTMFSAEVFKTMLQPAVTKLVTGLHAHGIYVEQHSCGMIESFIPHLIETGVDTWLGQDIIDKEKMVRTYGDSFKFGVRIIVPPPFEDEAILSIAEQLKYQYNGKRVWFSLPWTMPPSKKEMLGIALRQSVNAACQK